jgi:hypothetical protein
MNKGWGFEPGPTFEQVYPKAHADGCSRYGFGGMRVACQDTN